ncbi:pyridoxamine 5'-phosphate oxidase [Tessaracoccus sp. OH4464_COT-324]|uniref:pyridoxamine 5'-phosphate oxidase n=1 Tax=Tessaracoccus sp. OH4464_COT-324 TaxID=2491059 RepID=UPI000F63AC6D|nr:pyridoxamine 5'-phosphate oxidase [Tessaracoccus sp. OH4464_COT-324]RRD47306.1 pyridoxamine 5'-phosphate oxidase [Tessaracoccus sp. OH4464_COT-324]
MPGLHHVRTEFVGSSLPEDIADRDPWWLFDEWLSWAVAAELPEPTAMTLATVGPDGRPSARVVLLKEYSPAGLRFFTGRGSRKAREALGQGWGSASFFWPEPMRQVRAVGTVTELSRADSAEYFRTRPRASQLAAWVSPQSQPLASRAQLERELAEAQERFAGAEVPLPEHWGGFVLDVAEFEFWQGMPGRAHDRVHFVRTPEGWTGTRLYP